MKYSVGKTLFNEVGLVLGITILEQTHCDYTEIRKLYENCNRIESYWNNDMKHTNIIVAAVSKLKLCWR